MFDFLTSGDAPVPITIDGQSYSLPRFLLGSLKAWAAKKHADYLDKALANITDEEHRTRVRLYFSSPPVDVAAQLRELLTAEGVEYVISTSMREAGVPQATIDKVLRVGDPATLRTLAEELSLPSGAAKAIEDGVKKDDEDPNDPLPDQSGASDGSPSTGESA